ncbi:DUF4097 family beta strand repeat-containing protein [Paraliobacillus sediminis]|uniref:DUF4097 family beta strand repeat-containing protein n=1 Tax=Paraliobacillus sediminis TaxID=1885916 RepID=UPI000E3EE3AF|nr:DUF4097 family beta strand repeat-containing protein [Paraliobacillus sediminis]
MMKKIALVACLTLLIGIVGILTLRDRIFSDSSKASVNEEQVIDASDIKQIYVEADVVDIKIEKSSDENIHVFLDGKVSEKRKDNIDFRVEEDNGELKIDLKGEKQISISFLPLQDWGSIKLTILIPEKQFDKLDLVNNVGGIIVNYGDFNTVNVESDVGDVKLQEIISKSASVTSSVGDTSIRQAQGEWDIKSDVGEVDLQLKEWEQDITIVSDIGDIEVQVAKKTADYTLDLDSDIGDVTVDGFDLNRDGGKEVYLQSGSGEPLLKVSSDMGDIEVSTP